jgi:hypothetical protein
MLPSRDVSETRSTAGCALALAGALVCAAHAQERGRLLGVTAGGDAAASSIQLVGDRPLSFTTLKLSAPPRVVVDFADTDLSGAPEEVLVEDGTIRRVAAAAAGAKTARVVIELTADAEFDVSAHGSRVEVRVPRLAPLVAKVDLKPAEPAPSREAEKRASLPTVALVGSRPAPPPETDARRKAREQRVAAYVEDQRAAAAKAAAHKKANQDRQAAGKSVAAEKALAGQRAAAQRRAEQLAAKQAAEEKALAGQRVAAQRRAERVAAKKAAEEKALAEQRAAAQLAAQRRAGRLAAQRVAAEKAAAEQAKAAQAAAERRAAKRAAAEQQRLAAEQAAAERRAAKRAAAEQQRLAAEQEAAQRRLAAAERAAAQKRLVAVAGRSRPQRKIALAEPPRRAITGIGFRPNAGGEVIVRSDQPLEYGVSGEEHAILLHLPSTGIPLPNNRRPLDTRFFGGPVERVVPVTVPGGTDVRIELRRHAEYQLAQTGSVLTVTFAAPKP